MSLNFSDEEGARRSGGSQSYWNAKSNAEAGSSSTTSRIALGGHLPPYIPYEKVTTLTTFWGLPQEKAHDCCEIGYVHGYYTTRMEPAHEYREHKTLRFHVQNAPKVSDIDHFCR